MKGAGLLLAGTIAALPAVALAQAESAPSETAARGAKPSAGRPVVAGVSAAAGAAVQGMGKAAGQWEDF